MADVKHPDSKSKEEQATTSQAPQETNSRITRISWFVWIATSILFVIFWIQELRAPGFWYKQLHGDSSIEGRALKILSDHPLIDGHNDFLLLIRYLYQNHIYNSSFPKLFEHGGLPGHVDLPRIEKGKMGGAFWSAYVQCPEDGFNFSDSNYAPIVRATLEQLDLYNRLHERYPHCFSLSRDSAAAEKAFKKGHLISPIGIEGLHQIGNSISNLRLFYELGVRYSTLTHNCHNTYADAALVNDAKGDVMASKPYWGGVSPKGRALINEMNRMGMIVDLSHVSKDVMLDTLGGAPQKGWNGSLAAPIFSHSSAYALCSHPRNVPDDVLQLVKKRGALVMINFAPAFISCKAGNNKNGLPDTVPEGATLKRVVEHIKHIGESIGYDYVGIGTDFDGIPSTPQGLNDVSKFPDLVTEMLRQGVSDKDAAKVVGRNLLRVWKEVDEVAAKLQKETLPLEDDITPLARSKYLDDIYVSGDRTAFV